MILPTRALPQLLCLRLGTRSIRPELLDSHRIHCPRRTVAPLRDELVAVAHAVDLRDLAKLRLEHLVAWLFAPRQEELLVPAVLVCCGRAS